MAKISTLTDTFATKDLTKWTWAVNAAVANGQLTLTPTASYNGNIASATTYDLTESSFAIELVSPAAQTGTPGGGAVETIVSLVVDGLNTNSVSWRCNANELRAIHYVAGVGTNVVILTYDSTAHRWLRIRHASGVVYWETSANGSTWVQRATWTPTITLTAIKAELVSGHFGTVTAPTVALLDNVNPTVSDTTAPTVPTNVSTFVNSATSVTVSWGASTDAVGVASYRVRRNGVDVTGATALSPSVTSFTDTTISAGTANAVYSVSAVDAAGNRSGEGSAAAVSTPGVGQSPANSIPLMWTGSAWVPALISQRVTSWAGSANRPSSPSEGLVGTNSVTGALEWYSNGAWRTVGP